MKRRWITERVRKAKGSLTVEAAFVMPIILFAIISLLYFFVLMQTEFQVYQAMLSVSDDLYTYGTTINYVQNGLDEVCDVEVPEVAEAYADKLKEKALGFVNEQVGETYVKAQVQNYFEENELSLSCVKGGISGLSFDSSKIYVKEGEVEMVVEYAFEFPLDFFEVSEKEIRQKVVLKGFCGTGWELTGEFESEEESAEEDAEIVYVCETGSVYHVDPECVYITTRFEQVRYEDIATLRNNDGKIYYQCEACDDVAAGELVFISPYGTRFHTKSDCPNLKREVRQMTKEEALELGLRPCSNCGAEEEAVGDAEEGTE